MTHVIEIGKSGKYALENHGTYWAICEVSEDTPRHVYHCGKESYVRSRWNSYYKNVMYRPIAGGPRWFTEAYFEN